MRAFITILLCYSSFYLLSQTSYTWTGSSSSAWTVAGNWSPSGVPTASDYATITTGSNPCMISANTAIANLTVTSGTLNLGGFTLSCSGISLFNGGNCINGNFTTPGSSLTFAGTVIGANVTANVTDVYFNGSTFNGNLNVTRNNSTNIQSSGNNVFNGTTSITNAGAGYLLLTNNSAKTETFNGPVTFNTTGTGNLYIAYSGNSNYASGIVVNNTASTGSTYLGYNGKTTLTASNTITTGTFAGGMLYLYRFSQASGTAQTLSPGPNGGVAVYTSTVSGAFTINAGNIYTGNSIYAGAVALNKNGGTNNASGGGNTFNSTLTMNHTGAGYWSMGNGTADIFNGNLYLNNTCNAERIIIGHNSTNNQLNGNVYVTQSGAAQGTDIGFGGTAPVVTFAAGKTVIVGGAGFSAGYLKVFRLAQADATALSLNVTGTSNVILQDNVFTGNVDITTPDITPLGGTYNGTVHFVKTGGGSGNHNSGYQNIFNSTVNLENQSNTGYLLLSYNSSDQFNDNVTVSCTGTGGISFGWSGGTGAPVLAAGKTINIGPGGFTAGFLQLGGFTHLGSVPLNLTLTGTAYFQVIKPTLPCTFNAPVTVTAPDIYIQGGTFNAPASFIKTGGTNNHNSGYQNIFNSTLDINQQSNGGYFMLGYNSHDLFNDNITVTSTGSGGINLGWYGGNGSPTLASGKTILTGAGGFSSGYLRFGRFTQLGSVATTLNFTGSSSIIVQDTSLFNAAFNATAPDIYIQGGTFNGPASFTKTGGSSNHNNQTQNIFNSTCTINQQSSTGYFMLGYNSNELFNDNIIVTSTGTGGILLGWNSGTGTPTLASGKTILVGAGGFSDGYLQLNTFTQLGNAPINLTFTGPNTALTFARNSVIGGNLTCSTPDVYFNGATFNGSVDAVKTGTNNNASYGGNIFQAVSSFTNSGSGYLLFGNGSPDTWNSDVSFTNSGSERVLPAWNTAGNLFNGNITFNSTGSSQGINFCGNAVATATLAAGKTLYIGSAGFSAGYLILQRFTQLGNAPVTLSLSPTSSYLQYGPSSLLGGNVTSSSPGLYFHGCTFNGTTNCTKTGASSDQSNGNNIYNAPSVMNNTGSGYLLFGNAGYDQFNTTSTFNNLGSSHIYVAYNSSNNIFGGQVTFNNSPTSASSWIFVSSYMPNNSVFNGNIIVNNVNGAGVYFGSNTGTSTLSAGKTITIGAGGFNSGSFIMKNFTQVGNTAQSFTTTGTSNIQYGPGSSFDGDVTSVSPGLYFHGCTYNRTATCTKNGTTNDQSNGNNIFNGTTVMNNTGSGYLLFGNVGYDQFNTTSTFNNLGSSHIYVAYNSTNNIFGGQVTLNNTPTSASSWIYVATNMANNAVFNDNIIVSNVNGAGVSFGNNTGTSTLSTGKTITVGPAGFNSGALIMKNFTQVGSTAQSFTTTGTSNIQYGPGSVFGGNVTSVSPGLYFHGCNFLGTTLCTKNGPTNDQSNGNNTFTGASVMNDVGAGYLLFGNVTHDQFQSAVTLNNTGSSGIYMAYNSPNNVFNGLITLNNNPSATSGFIHFAPYNTGHQVNDNVVINQTQGTTYFGYNAAPGAITQANGKTINSGTLSGGDVYVYNYSQSAPATGLASTINNTSATSGNLYINNSIFYDDFSGIYPNIRNVQASTFNGAAILTKKGGNNQETWYGGNVYNGTTVVTNQSSTAAYYLYLACNAADDYNGDLTFANTGISNIIPNYNTNCTYAGNITVTTPAAIAMTFGTGTNGIATLDGTNAVTINKTAGSLNPVFTRLVLNKPSNTATLNTRINITSYLTPTSGVMYTTQTNILNMNNAATTTIGNAASYIDGPMNYDMAVSGNRVLNMPIGKTGDWRPAVLNLTHGNATSYTYNSEVFDMDAHALNWSYPPTVNNVSRVHWWDIGRTLTGSSTSTPTAGLSGNQGITLYFGTNDVVVDGSTLTICKNTYTATSAWIDIGGSGAPAYSGGANLTGSVMSTSSPSAFNSFSRFTLANKTGGIYNPLPIELLGFDAVRDNNVVSAKWSTATEVNNSHFELERSKDGAAFEYVTTVGAYGNGNSLVQQNYSAIDAKPYSDLSYYRLKEVDKNGSYRYSNIVSVDFTGRGISIYPNPTAGDIWVNTGASALPRVKVIDESGAEVVKEYTLTDPKGHVDLSHLAPGVYFIILNDGAAPVRTRIVVQ